MAEDNLDTNIAITLRDIAANCDQKSGKVIRLCEAAARDGLDHLEVKVSTQDRDYLNTRKRAAYEGHWYDDDKKKLATLSVPPLIQKLESLGFKLESSDRYSPWKAMQCYIIARW